MVQQPAHRGWHRVNRSEESLTGAGSRAGDGRAEGWSVIRDGGAGSVSLMSDADGTGIDSLLD